VEAGEIIETAFITELLDADAVVEQQLTGVTDPDLREKLRIGLAGTGLEIPAERIRHQPHYGGDLLEVDRACEMSKGIIVNGVDAVILRLCEIMAEAH